MLFGEHAVLHGSRALAVPYANYAGQLKFAAIEPDAQQVNSNKNLHSFAEYLNDQLSTALNITALKKEISEGIFFESSIPTGYGLGSSGALVAAIYDRYKQHSISNWKDLRPMFEIMESFFHGKSSGLDPLICFLNSPISVSTSGLQLQQIPDYQQGNAGIFLLNTKIPRETGPLVNSFLKRCEKDSYLGKIKSSLLPLNHQLIKAFCSGNIDSLYENWQKVSAFQLDYFDQLIPEMIKPFWQEGLSSNEYWLKVCGAGGGGFMLGLCPNIVAMQNAIDFHTEIIYKFQLPAC